MGRERRLTSPCPAGLASRLSFTKAASQTDPTMDKAARAEGNPVPWAGGRQWADQDWKGRNKVTKMAYYLAQSTERRREDITEDGGEETVEQGEWERNGDGEVEGRKTAPPDGSGEVDQRDGGGGPGEDRQAGLDGPEGGEGGEAQREATLLLAAMTRTARVLCSHGRASRLKCSPLKYSPFASDGSWPETGVRRNVPVGDPEHGAGLRGRRWPRSGRG